MPLTIDALAREEWAQTEPREGIRETSRVHWKDDDTYLIAYVICGTAGVPKADDLMRGRLIAASPAFLKAIMQIAAIEEPDDDAPGDVLYGELSAARAIAQEALINAGIV